MQPIEKPTPATLRPRTHVGETEVLNAARCLIKKANEQIVLSIEADDKRGGGHRRLLQHSFLATRTLAGGGCGFRRPDGWKVCGVDATGF